MQRRNGFSTLELLVGMTLLALMATAAMVYFRYDTKAAVKSDAFFISTQVAARGLEASKRRLSDPDTLKAILADLAAGRDSLAGTETIQGKDYKYLVRYQRVSAGGNLMKVRASVYWDGHQNSMGMAFPFTP